MTISTMESRNHKFKKAILVKGTVLFLWLFLWQLAYWAVGQDLLLASPLDVCSRIFVLVKTIYLWIFISGFFRHLFSSPYFTFCCFI